MKRLTALLVIAFTTATAIALADAGETRFPSSQRTHAAGGGNLSIRARCPRSAVDDCAGDVRLAHAIGEFGTGEAYTRREPFSLSAGQRGRLVVQLTQRAMRLLERRGSLDAKAVVYPSGQHGPPNHGGFVEVLAPCPGATEFTSGC